MIRRKKGSTKTLTHIVHQRDGIVSVYELTKKFRIGNCSVTTETTFDEPATERSSFWPLSFPQRVFFSQKVKKIRWFVKIVP
jgi:hypothetical protein